MEGVCLICYPSILWGTHEVEMCVVNATIHTAKCVHLVIDGAHEIPKGNQVATQSKLRDSLLSALSYCLEILQMCCMLASLYNSWNGTGNPLGHFQSVADRIDSIKMTSSLHIHQQIARAKIQRNCQPYLTSMGSKMEYTSYIQRPFWCPSYFPKLNSLSQT